MSKVVYNNIAFHEITTKSMNFKAVYSDDGLEYRHTEVDLSFSAIVSLKIPPAADSIGGNNTDADVGATIRRIRYLLLTPRKELQFYLDGQALGTPLLDTPPIPNRPRDPINGPLPQSLNITRIDGTAAIWVDYSIKTAIVESASDKNPPISSHRWSESVSIDENFYSRKTRNGTVYCRADLKDGNAVDIDQLREFFIPAIPAGFKLESMNYNIDPGGLKMTYTHVFKEQFLQPPYPATKASGTFGISSNIGAIRIAECSCRLEGAKTTPKDKLIAAAILVVCTKLRGVNGHFAGRAPFNNTAKYPVFKGMSVREGLFENWVEVSAKAQMPATKARTQGAPIKLVEFGIDVGGINPPNYGMRGTAGLLVRAAQQYLAYDTNSMPTTDWKSNPNASNQDLRVT